MHSRVAIAQIESTGGITQHLKHTLEAECLRRPSSCLAPQHRKHTRFARASLFAQLARPPPLPALARSLASDSTAQPMLARGLSSAASHLFCGGGPASLLLLQASKSGGVLSGLFPSSSSGARAAAALPRAPLLFDNTRSLSAQAMEAPQQPEQQREPATPPSPRVWLIGCSNAAFTSSALVFRSCRRGRRSCRRTAPTSRPSWRSLVVIGVFLRGESGGGRAVGGRRAAANPADVAARSVHDAIGFFDELLPPPLTPPSAAAAVCASASTQSSAASRAPAFSRGECV